MAQLCQSLNSSIFHFISIQSTLTNQSCHLPRGNMLLEAEHSRATDLAFGRLSFLSLPISLHVSIEYFSTCAA